MKKLWPAIVRKWNHANSVFRQASTIAAVIVGCSSCNSQKPVSSKDPFRCYLMTEPFSLDPRVGGDYRSQIIVGELFEGLLRMDKEGIPQPALAQSFDLSPDKKTYTFHLRTSVWSNGSKVTANDFAYAWKSVISHDVQSRHASAFFCIKNAQRAFENACSMDEVGIRVLDEMTLQVDLEHPATFFLEWVANPLYSPVNSSILKKHGIVSPSEELGYICNGPYTLFKREINQCIELVKNPLYWNAGAVQNNMILFSIIEDPCTAFNLFCKGELDWFGEPFGVMSSEMTEALISQKKMNVAKGGLLNWVRCNVTVKHLSSPKIRKAIACAINRRELASKLMFDLVFPSFTILPAKQSLLEHPVFRDHDVERARQLFKEGLLELGLTEETFPQLTLSCQADPRTIAICELLTSQIHKALGIDVQMQVLDIKRFWDEIFQNHLEMSYAGWISGLTDPIYNLESIKEIGGHYKTTGWENQAYADLLNASDAEVNPRKRAELLLAAETLIMDEMPVIPVLEVPFRYAKQSNIKGEFFTPIGRIEFSGLERQV